MSELEKRKRLLVAECEVYRETLKLELQTFKLYGIYTRKRLASLKTYAPLVLTGLPLMRALFLGRKKISSWKRFGSMFFVAWQAYQRFGPLMRNAFRSPPEKTAAEEYLSKRI